MPGQQVDEADAVHPEHDDRAEFLAGITFVLAGITAVHPAGRIDL
jgi:hypothetical protein